MNLMLDLPNELLHAILLELGIRDLEHVEQTCRALAKRDHTILWRRQWLVASPFHASQIQMGSLVNQRLFSLWRTMLGRGNSWTSADDSLLIYYFQSLADQPRLLADMHDDMVACVNSMVPRRKKRTHKFITKRISELRRERLSDLKVKSLPITVACSACGCDGPHMCGKRLASAHKTAIALHVTLSCGELIRALTRSM